VQGARVQNHPRTPVQPESGRLDLKIPGSDGQVRKRINALGIGDHALLPVRVLVDHRDLGAWDNAFLCASQTVLERLPPMPPHKRGVRIRNIRGQGAFPAYGHREFIAPLRSPRSRSAPGTSRERRRNAAWLECS